MQVLGKAEIIMHGVSRSKTLDVIDNTFFLVKIFFFSVINNEVNELLSQETSQ
jgi:hypothetical protein